MAHLFAFLLKLVSDRFYGDVRIRFQDGKIHGQVEVHSAYLVSTLPQPDVNDPAYQKVLAETVRGVAAPS